MFDEFDMHVKYEDQEKDLTALVTKESEPNIMAEIGCPAFFFNWNPLKYSRSCTSSPKLEVMFKWYKSVFQDILQ